MRSILYLAIGGLITLERARVVMYRPANVRASQAEMHRIEGLTADDDS